MLFDQGQHLSEEVEVVTKMLDLAAVAQVVGWNSCPRQMDVVALRDEELEEQAAVSIEHQHKHAFEFLEVLTLDRLPRELKVFKQRFILWESQLVKRK